MKMFKMMAASMLGVALCLGFTACSDDDENENGEGGENTNCSFLIFYTLTDF